MVSLPDFSSYRVIAEIDDVSLGLRQAPDPLRPSYNERYAARAVVFNPQGEIVLLHATKRNYHKLPGGGIDPGETWQEALAREAVEEIGCRIQLRPIEPFQIVEYRAEHRLRQVSICGVADVVEDLGKTALEAGELAIGLDHRVWLPLQAAIDLMKRDAPNEWEGHFISLRDLTFLQESQKALEK